LYSLTDIIGDDWEEVEFDRLNNVRVEHEDRSARIPKFRKRKEEKIGWTTFIQELPLIIIDEYEE